MKRVDNPHRNRAIELLLPCLPDMNHPVAAIVDAIMDAVKVEIDTERRAAEEFDRKSAESQAGTENIFRKYNVDEKVLR